MAKKQATMDDLAKSVEDVAKSVDDLARITLNGFSEVHKKMDEGFTRVDARLDAVEQTQSKHSDRLDKIDGTLADHGERLEKIEYGIDLLKLSIKDIRTEIAHLTALVRESTNPKEITQLKQRVSILEAELAKR